MAKSVKGTASVDVGDPAKLHKAGEKIVQPTKVVLIPKDELPAEPAIVEGAPFIVGPRRRLPSLPLGIHNKG